MAIRIVIVRPLAFTLPLVPAFTTPIVGVIHFAPSLQRLG
jgi:hypothetical protein